MSETTGWTYHAEDYYWKILNGATYCVFNAGNGCWRVRRGHIKGRDHIGEYRKFSDAKRAAHRHAEGVDHE